MPPLKHTQSQLIVLVVVSAFIIEVNVEDALVVLNVLKVTGQVDE